MKLLKIVYRHPDLPRAGKISFRTAVRAIIVQQDKLLCPYLQIPLIRLYFPRYVSPYSQFLHYRSH